MIESFYMLRQKLDENAKEGQIIFEELKTKRAQQTSSSTPDHCQPSTSGLQSVASTSAMQQSLESSSSESLNEPKRIKVSTEVSTEVSAEVDADSMLRTLRHMFHEIERFYTFNNERYHLFYVLIY